MVSTMEGDYREELRKAHQEISNLKKRHQLFYDDLPDLLRTIDTDGIIINCNKAYAEAFGYSKDELIGKSVFNFIAEEGRDSYSSSFKTWIETGEVRNRPVWFSRKDGTKFLALVSASNLYDENNQLIGSNTVIKDISDLNLAKKQIEKNEKRLKQQLKKLKKSNERLTIAEKRYRNLYDKTPILLRTITLEGILTDCNDAYAKSLGYTKEEMIGSSLFDHTAERSMKEMEANIAKWKETHETEPVEIWLKRKDGSIFPAMLTGSSLYDEYGNMVGRTLSLVDMTEIYSTRKRMEENGKQLQSQLVQLRRTNLSLAATEQRYRGLYEKSPGLLRTISKDGIVIDCNEAYAKSLGYTKEEAIGASFFKHTAEKSLPDLNDDYQNWQNTHEITHKEIWMKRKDGSMFPCLMSGTSLYDENKELIGRTVVLTDLTEIFEVRKKLEEDEARIREQYDELKRTHDYLSSTEKKYRTLYETTPIMMRTISSDGTIKDCNDTYAKSLGYTKEEIVGSSLFNHTAERSLNEMKANLEKWNQTHDVTSNEIWMKRKDGSIFPVILSGASIYDEQGNVIGRTVALTDMSESYEIKRKLEEKEARIREQYEDLKKLDVAKEEFTSMISHELKTPLTPIMGWCQALKSPKILGSLNPKQLEAIEAIQSNAGKLRDLVGEMLDSQKLDMKKMKFDCKFIDVNEMMSFITKNVQSAVEPKHIEFLNLTTENLVLKSDRNRIEQILNNMIFNSIDFVPERGRIEVKATKKDDRVLFIVKDNGIGIPKDKQTNLFKQFYQLDTSATRKHGGSGLGLSICKGIVEALGGEIWLESDQGKGATFYFTIPNEIKTDGIEIEHQNPSTTR
ncbi:MAG TPA: PAS domain-containing sensor histidine kinase [Candidatus Nitrosotalea sp.]|nr:PAS domain-containing sensor histidine kinase [Candidatus Nitrosotalea sp.]